MPIRGPSDYLRRVHFHLLCSVCVIRSRAHHPLEASAPASSAHINLRNGYLFYKVSLAVTVRPDSSSIVYRSTIYVINRRHHSQRDLHPTSYGKTKWQNFPIETITHALTLHHWVRRLEGHAEEPRRITDDTTYRTWRLYMAASANRFRAAGMNLYQVLLSKPLKGKSGMSLTCADW